MTRRGLVRRAAVAGGTMVAAPAAVDQLAPRYSPVGRADASLLVAGTLVAGGAVAGLLVGVAATGGGDANAEAILEQRANELHDRIYADATEMRMGQEPTIESLQGDVAMLRQLARSDAGFSIMQSASDEVGESQATTNAKDAVRDAFAKVEANFFDMWTTEMDKAQRRAGLAGDNDKLAYQDVFDVFGDYSTGDYAGHSPGAMDPNSALGENGENPLSETGAELVNGDMHTVSVIHYVDDYPQIEKTKEIIMVPWSSVPSVSSNPYNELNSSDTANLADPISVIDLENETYNDPNIGMGGQWGAKALDRESADTAEMINATEWMAVHDQLMTMLDEELTHVETMVSNLYQPAVDGEIDVHSLSSGSAVLEEARDGNLSTWKEVAGIYRSMRMGEAKDPAVVTLPNGVELEGLLFWSEPDLNDGLAVGESINPNNTTGRLYLAAEIRSVPEPEQEDMASVTITVEDGSGNAVTDAVINVKGGDTSHSVDSNGEVSVEVEAGPTTFYVTDSDGTTSETARTIEVADGDSISITHDGTDQSSFNADPFSGETLTSDDEGKAIPVRLSDPFAIEGVHEKPDATALQFEKPLTVEPSDDFGKYKDAAEDAAQDEEETREETTKVVIEQTGGGPGPIFDGGNPLEDGGGLLGLGIIGVVVLAVVGFVTDMIPGLGGN
ncbi:hypothetical protein A6E15_02130 [Natrinema saccharevitans]|uniref:Envelope protein N-terminal domain-containing protein n=2 Tax=Natrinema saccharevitans TaxID=301967 RepID=A0A1S8ASQ7_9EURY|nr:hypothetical protein A6E15_02130 [Natrinema saccharevitans]